MDSTFLSLNYSLTIDLDIFAIVEILERLKDNFSYLPIKQLYFQSLEEPSISELMKILIQLPYVSFLSVETEYCSTANTKQNWNINEEDRFNNIECLQLSKKITKEWIACLMNHLPKVNYIHQIKSESDSDSEDEYN